MQPGVDPLSPLWPQQDRLPLTFELAGGTVLDGLFEYGEASGLHRAHADGLRLLEEASSADYLQQRVALRCRGPRRPRWQQCLARQAARPPLPGQPSPPLVIVGNAAEASEAALEIPARAQTALGRPLAAAPIPHPARVLARVQPEEHAQVPPARIPHASFLQAAVCMEASRLLYLRKELRKALACADQAMAVEGPRARGVLGAGVVLSRLGLHREALTMAHHALRAAGRARGDWAAVAWHNVAVECERLDASPQVVETARREAAREAEAHPLRAKSRGGSPAGARGGREAWGSAPGGDGGGMAADIVSGAALRELLCERTCEVLAALEARPGGVGRKTAGLVALVDGRGDARGGGRRRARALGAATGPRPPSTAKRPGAPRRASLEGAGEAPLFVKRAAPIHAGRRLGGYTLRQEVSKGSSGGSSRGSSGGGTMWEGSEPGRAGSLYSWGPKAPRSPEGGSTRCPSRPDSAPPPRRLVRRLALAEACALDRLWGGCEDAHGEADGAARRRAAVRILRAQRAREEGAAIQIQKFWRAARAQRVMAALMMGRIGERAAREKENVTLRRHAAVNIVIKQRRPMLEHWAARTIQAYVRGWLNRLRLRRAREALYARAQAVINKNIKRHLARCSVRRRNEVARYLQARLKKVIVRRRVRDLAGAARKAQPILRGAIARRRLREDAHGGAVHLQRVWRGHRWRGVEAPARARSVTHIRRVWASYSARAQLADRGDRQARIAARLRGGMARNGYAAWREASCLITATWERICSRRMEARRERAARLIQNAWANYYAVLWLGLAREGVRRIQRTYRAFRVRRHVSVLRAAANTIGGYRGAYLTKKWVATLVRATRSIQSAGRMYVQKKQLRRASRAVSVIAGFYRGGVLRREMRRLYLAAVACQAIWRGGEGRRRAIILRHASAVIVRRSFFLVARRVNQRGVQAAALIQAAARKCALKWLHDRQHRCATIIAKRWRRRAAVRARAVFLGKVAKIQARVRGVVARRELKARHAAASTLQARYKLFRHAETFVARRELVRRCGKMWHCRTRYLIVRRRIVVLQRHARMLAGKLLARRMDDAATRIQRCWCMHAGQVEVYRQAAAATRIQARVRGLLSRNHLDLMDRAAMGCQFPARIKLARRRVWEARDDGLLEDEEAWGTLTRYNRLRERATLLLQRTCRGWAARRAARREEAIVLRVQCAWRGHVARARVLGMRRAARVIVRALRNAAGKRLALAARTRGWAAAVLAGWMLGARDRRSLQAESRAAYTIQAEWGRRKGVLSSRAKLTAAVLIQRFIRMHLARQRRRNAIAKVYVFQAMCWGRAVRRSRPKRQRAAWLLQRAWRRAMASLRVRRMVGAAITIQRWRRGWMARRRVRSMRVAATMADRAFRAFRLRRVVQQAAVLEREALADLLRIESAIDQTPEDGGATLGSAAAGARGGAGAGVGAAGVAARVLSGEGRPLSMRTRPTTEVGSL